MADPPAKLATTTAATTPKAPNAAAAKKGSELIPGLDTKLLAVPAAIVAGIWVIALLTQNRWVIGIVGVLTLLLVGAIAYLIYWARRQRGLMELLQGANASPEARKEALAKLNAQKGADGDAMNALARAQLEAQEDPDKAAATLESIDLAKAGPLADTVRLMRTQIYLGRNRTREAREMADGIKLSNAPAEPEARGMMVAVVAEAWSRTGKGKEAMDLLQTVKPDDPDFGQARAFLLVARVYAHFATAQRDAVRKDMMALVKLNPDLMSRFVAPQMKPHPELQKIAREVLQRDPEMRRLAQQQVKYVRRPR